MSHQIPRPTWLEISTSALTNNVQRLQGLLEPGCRLMAIIKANGYGHGAVETARTVLAAGAEQLGVATLTEALELRHAGIVEPILVLGYTPGDLATVALEHAVTLTLYDTATALAIDTASRQHKLTAHVHLKVNTGMNRLGLSPKDTLAFMQKLNELAGLEIEGIYTHFATADHVDKSGVLRQFAEFRALLTQLTRLNLCPPIAHAANSAATITLPQTHLDMVRCGIALYGLHPDVEQTRLPIGFRPALCWKAKIAQVRILAPGEGVSYGWTYRASGPRTVATIPVGYADGFPRTPQHWCSVLIRGQHVPIIGRVCMDQTIVDVTAVVAQGGAVVQGETAVLIGDQNGMQLSVDEIAARTGTINYEVVSRILPRVPRVYR